MNSNKQKPLKKKRSVLKVLSLLFILICLIVPTIIQAQEELRLGLPLGHTGVVNSLAFSPDGSFILTASFDKTAKVWEASTGRLLYTLWEHESSVMGGKYSPDGELIVTSSDKTIRVWEASTGQLLYTLLGHEQSVNSVEFSPDGSLIVSASSDNTVRVWDTTTGVLLQTLESHTSAIWKAVFNPEGSRILTTSSDETAKVWDAASGQLLYTLEEHTSTVWSAVFSADGSRIVTRSWSETARVWEASSGQLLHTLLGHERTVNSAEFSPDGLYIVTASADNTVRLWDTTTGELLHILNGHTDDVQTAVFNPSGNHIVTTSRDGTARVWDTYTGMLLYTLEGIMGNHYTDNGAVFSPDGSRIVMKTGEVWEASSGQLLHTLGGHTGWVSNTTFNSDGTRFLTGSFGNTAQLWDNSTGQLLHKLEGHTSMLGDWSAGFSPDGYRIVTTSGDNTAKVWETSSGQLQTTLKGHTNSVIKAVFSQDGSSIVTASADGTARVWETSTGELLHTLGGHRDAVQSVEFSPDGSLILSASYGWDNTARVWEASTGHLLQVLEGPTTYIKSATFSPDGTQILITSLGRAAHLWDVSTFKLLYLLEGDTHWVQNAAFSPDGSSIVTASADGIARIWEASSGRLLHLLEGHIDEVISAEFSMDGSLIVTASIDNTARIWESSSGALLYKLEGHSYSLKGATFSPDASHIVTASEDGSIIFWDIQTGEMLLQKYPFTNGHVTLHPSGLFDATEEAMELMYWIRGTETIGFEQLRDRFWEPGLWQKVMRGETLRDVQGLENLRLYPELNLAEVDESGNLPIELTKRDGGYGRVVVRINGKEIAMDARGEDFDPTQEQVSLSVPIAGHPFLLPGEENSIEVLVYEQDNWLHSRTIGVSYVPEPEPQRDPPQLFVVSVGVSDYTGTAIDLRFAAKDAEDMALALELAGGQLFGEDRTHIYTLSTYKPDDYQPTRANISRVFGEIAGKATSEDVLIVYMAGHGISVGGSLGDFHFLTREAWSASAAAYSDPELRASVTLSSGELTQYINSVPALKQVLILDTCASGQVVEDLIASRDGLDSATIRSLDRMRDRTGMFVLTGSAADAVSYEASSFGQGVLTYSILEAMRGAALREDQFVDVSTLFSYSRDRVPQLAEGIGGIQVPQVFSPRGGASFDIGRVPDEKKELIPLASIKPVFVRSNFINSNEFEDNVNLSTLVDNLLLDTSARGANAPLIWVDARNHPNACRITGGYEQTGDEIELQLRLRCGDDTDERITKTANSAQELAEKIVKWVEER